MAQNVGFIYGKAKEKDLTISAGNHISSINYTYGTHLLYINSNNSISDKVKPGEHITLDAALPASVISSTLYHDGITPKADNYYYNNNTIYTFESWKDGNNNVLSSNASYVFNMPSEDIMIIGEAIETISEINKVYAIPITIENSDSNYITSVFSEYNSNIDTDGSSVTTYIWPGENITIGGNPIASNTSSVSYSGCDADNKPLSGEAYAYTTTTDYYISLISNSSNDYSVESGNSITLSPSAANTYSVIGSSSQNINTTGCESSSSSWTSGSINGLSFTTSHIHSSRYWFSSNTANGYDITSVGDVEERAEYIQSSSLYKTEAASSSSYYSVSTIAEGTTVNGLFVGSNTVKYSNSVLYATVGSQTWGSTNGAYTTSASRRTTSSSWSSGTGNSSGAVQYERSNYATYGTSHYISTYPLTAQSLVGYKYTLYKSAKVYQYNTTFNKTAYDGRIVNKVFLTATDSYNGYVTDEDHPCLFIANLYAGGYAQVTNGSPTYMAMASTTEIYIPSNIYNKATSAITRYFNMSFIGDNRIFTVNNMVDIADYDNVIHVFVGNYASRSAVLGAFYYQSNYNYWITGRYIYNHLLTTSGYNTRIQTANELGTIITYFRQGSFSRFNVSYVYNYSTTGTQTTTYSISNG